jgi:hypothetical protein
MTDNWPLPFSGNFIDCLSQNQNVRLVINSQVKGQCKKKPPYGAVSCLSGVEGWCLSGVEGQRVPLKIYSLSPDSHFGH